MREPADRSYPAAAALMAVIVEGEDPNYFPDAHHDSMQIVEDLVIFRMPI